jgi:hypothetical protein
VITAFRVQKCAADLAALVENLRPRAAADS